MKDLRSNVIKSSDIKDIPNNPIFDGLPDNLKDINIYNKIEKKILSIMYSDHKHKSVKSFVGCKRCKDKMEKRNKYILSLGFKSYFQYIQWKKVISFIKDNQLNKK